MWEIISKKSFEFIESIVFNKIGFFVMWIRICFKYFFSDGRDEKMSLLGGGYS